MKFLSFVALIVAAASAIQVRKTGSATAAKADYKGTGSISLKVLPAKAAKTAKAVKTWKSTTYKLRTAPVNTKWKMYNLMGTGAKVTA